MKKTWLLLLSFATLFTLAANPAAAGAKVPMNLGGFTLGADIHDYKDRIDLDTCHAVRYQEYLSEGVMKPSPGFKSGLISFGLCDKVHKVVRIKLKFLNPSKRFFKKLLKKYEKQLGPPDEYKGDPFQTMIAWKWSFESDSGQRVSLTLQHNLADTDEKIGNAVKMTLVDQVEREKECFYKKHPEKVSPLPVDELKGKAMWEMYVPY